MLSRSSQYAGVSLVVVGLTLVAVGTAAAQQRQDWPVRCNLRTNSLSFYSSGFWLRFRGASTGSNARQPAEGECAWADRGWGQDEPERLAWDAGEELLIRVDFYQDRQWPALIPNQQANQASRNAINTVFEAWKAGGMLTFFAYRDGNVMRVTRVAR